METGRGGSRGVQRAGAGGGRGGLFVDGRRGRGGGREGGNNERLGNERGSGRYLGKEGTEERSEGWGREMRRRTKRSGKRKPGVLEFRLESTACETRAMPHRA